MKNLFDPFVALVALAPVKHRTGLIVLAMLLMVTMLAIVVFGLAHTVAAPFLISGIGVTALWQRFIAR